MKKYIVILLVWLAISCTPDDSVESVTYFYAGIKPTGLPASILENSGTTVNIPVLFGGALENDESFTVSYTVTGGTYGADYTIVGGSSASGTVTISTGAQGVAMGTISIVPVADFVFEASVVLTLTLNEASNGYNIGYPLKDSYKLTIANDDCDFIEADFAPKTAKSREIYSASTYPAAGVTCLGVASRYCTEFTKTGTNAWELDNLWDAGWVVPVLIDPTDPGNITATIPETVVDGFGSTWTITGEGVLTTCDKKILITIHLTDTVYGYDDYQFVQEYTF